MATDGLHKLLFQVCQNKRRAVKSALLILFCELYLMNMFVSCQCSLPVLNDGGFLAATHPYHHLDTSLSFKFV